MSSHSEDEDCAFLDQVLDKLYDFGSAEKKKRKKRRRCEEECRNIQDEGLVEQVERTVVQSDGQRLRRTEEEKVEKVEVITFQDPRKKIKPKRPAALNTDPEPVTREKNQTQLEELSLEKARLEVHRFGITGYRKEQQREFEQDRAVMLGARPPKKSYMNYKLLQETIRERKRRAKEEVPPELKKKKKRNQQDNKKKVSSSGTGAGTAPTGQVGRFKDGMLILSSKEIQKIKGKRGAK